jgi:hypothetical protein
MPSLHETQALLMRAVRGGAMSPAVLTLLRDGAGATAERRLRIYRHNHCAGLVSALEAVYPVVARLVGRDCFRRIGRLYIDRHPPATGHLHPFGQRLPQFLRTEPALQGLPYLGDVAALEWAMHEVYHEADGVALDAAALAPVPAEAQTRLCLHLQLASRFVASPYPVLAIWRANQAAADALVDPVSLADGGDRLLVARGAFEVEMRVLGAAEDRWLRALAEGRHLAGAVQAALAVDAGFDLGAVLCRHLALGSFRGWSLAADEDAP